MQMLLKLDAESLHCAYGIFELDVLERKAREDGGLQFFQKLHGGLQKHFKTSDKAKGEPLLSEQGLFVDAKQSLDSKAFIDDIKQHQMKAEHFVPHPKNSNECFVYNN